MTPNVRIINYYQKSTVSNANRNGFQRRGSKQPKFYRETEKKTDTALKTNQSYDMINKVGASLKKINK